MLFNFQGYPTLSSENLLGIYVGKSILFRSFPWLGQNTQHRQHKEERFYFGYGLSPCSTGGKARQKQCDRGAWWREKSLTSGSWEARRKKGRSQGQEFTFPAQPQRPASNQAPRPLRYSATELIMVDEAIND